MSSPDENVADLSSAAGSELDRGQITIVLVYATGLTLAAMLLAVRHVYIALGQVLPMSVSALGVGACVVWGLSRRGVADWLVVIASSAAGGLAALLALTLLLSAQGKTLAMALGRGYVQQRLLAGPLLAALFALGLVQLRRSRERERRAWLRQAQAQWRTERLGRERLQAELQLLQAQLQPHFLYNTLANLRHLVRTDPPRGLAMLEHLIRYFKLALPQFREEHLPLSEELSLVESYVALLRERTDRPPLLKIDVPADLMRLGVPGGALLCLVENALKHGLPEDPAHAPQLLVQACRSAQGLRLTVSDNGPGLRGGSAAADSTGTGLRNLHDRLQLLHGQQASLRLSDRGAGCDAVLELPLIEP